jgi:hypothetical protein
MLTARYPRIVLLWSQAERWLQVTAAMLLAAYPWAYALGAISPNWPLWLMALGIYSLWLALRPIASRLLPATSLALILGLCFIQVLIIYHNIIIGNINRDYLMLASMIFRSSRDPGAVPANLWFTSASYLQGYFDPLVPLLNLVVDLTHDPFRLLGFHAAAILSSAIVTWWLTLHEPALRPYQFLLPTALLLHPAIFATVQADYHTSGIGISLLLAGTYFFFLERRRLALWLLLLGTLTKISYWPSWIMFGLIYAYRRQWRWAGTYLGLAAAALIIHQSIQRGNTTPGINLFFNNLGQNPQEMAYNFVMKPYLWTSMFLNQEYWGFFGLLLPLGFFALSYLPALIPTVPLIIFTMLDITGYRAIVPNVYAAEYMGFMIAATLLGLPRLSPQLRLGAIAAITLGTLLSFNTPENLDRWTMTVDRAITGSSTYERDVAFSACVVDNRPVLTTDWHWSTFMRGTIDSAWADESDLDVDKAPWDTFETLVYPANPDHPMSLARLPQVQLPFDVPHYTALLARLPYTVVTTSGWRYHGGPRLAECADRFGYQVSQTGSAAPPSPDRWIAADDRPIVMKVAFGHDRPPGDEPLLTTGTASAGDFFYVSYLPDDRVVFGFKHWGRQRMHGSPVVVQPGRFYTLALFASASEQKIRVTLDGNEVLRGASPLYPTTSYDLSIGKNWIASDRYAKERITSPRFSGVLQLPGIGPLQPDLGRQALPLDKPIKIQITFRTDRTPGREPLVTIGRTSRGDFFYVHYLPDGRVAFGFDHWGYPLIEGEPLAVEPGRPYRLEVFALPYERKFLVTLDGQLAVQGKSLLYPASKEEITIGENRIGGSIIDAWFSGDIQSVGNELWQPSPRRWIAPGIAPISLRLSFLQQRPPGLEPLATTGAVSAGDFFFVRYLPDGRVAFGFDHWGYPLIEGDPLPITPGTSYTIEVFMDPAEQRFLVRFDGNEVLRGASPLFPADPAAVTAGENRIGGNVIGPWFSGDLEVLPSAVWPLAPRRWIAPEVAPIGMRLSFPAQRPPGLEPLVTTGAAGAGDFFFVRYLPDGRAAFGFDHWGYPLIEGDPLAVESGRVYSVEVFMSPAEQRFLVTLDGRVVLRDASPLFLTTPAQTTVGENRIGGHVVADRFSGAIELQR